MITNSGNSSDTWDATAAKAAEQARQLRPWAQVIISVALLLIVGDYFGQPSFEMLRSAKTPTWLEALNQYLMMLLNAAPAFALLGALGSAERYLAKLEKGAVWSVATVKLVREVGECLVASAVFSVLVIPTVNLWVAGRGAFDWQWDAIPLSLLGLGLMFILLARVLAQVLESARQLKAENESFV